MNEQTNAVASTEAVKPVTQTPVHRQELTLFAFGNIIDAEDSTFQFKVLKKHEKSKDSEGNEVLIEKDTGFEVRPGKKSDVAKKLELVGKDNAEELARIMQAEADELMRYAKGEIASLGNNYTFQQFKKQRNTKTGLHSMTLKIKEVKRPQGVTDEQIARAWNIPLEAVAEFRKKHMKLASPVVDVTSTTQPEETEQQRLEREEREFNAECEAEAQRNAQADAVTQ